LKHVNNITQVAKKIIITGKPRYQRSGALVDEGDVEAIPRQEVRACEAIPLATHTHVDCQDEQDEQDEMYEVEKGSERERERTLLLASPAIISLESA